MFSYVTGSSSRQPPSPGGGGTLEEVPGTEATNARPPRVVMPSKPRMMVLSNKRSMNSLPYERMTNSLGLERGQGNFLQAEAAVMKSRCHDVTTERRNAGQPRMREQREKT